MPKFLSVQDLVRRYGVSRTTIYRWITNRGLPMVRLGFGNYRILQSALVEWEKSQNDYKSCKEAAKGFLKGDDR